MANSVVWWISGGAVWVAGAVAAVWLLGFFGYGKAWADQKSVVAVLAVVWPMTLLGIALASATKIFRFCYSNLAAFGTRILTSGESAREQRDKHQKVKEEEMEKLRQENSFLRDALLEVERMDGVLRGEYP